MSLLFVGLERGPARERIVTVTLPRSSKLDEELEQSLVFVNVPNFKNRE